MLKLNDLSKRQLSIINSLADDQWHAASQLIKDLSSEGSSASLKRDLKALLDAGIIEQFGKARATKYRRSINSKYLGPLNVEKYFARSQDERGQTFHFNFDIFSQLGSIQIFDKGEKKKLTELLKTYQKNIKNLPPAILKREFERVTIDLSWKSSSIEGNTYTLLETEALLRDGISAPGKTEDEARMLINHKTALEFVRQNHQDFKTIDVSKIELVHSILSKDLGISKNIRKRIVGITGTNYKPIDNEFQIREALEGTCGLVNRTKDVFEKAFLSILFISYIQPFEDGNKRTARLIGNAALLAHEAFPLSFRNVEVTHYKKAILLFYETNNLSEFKNLFLDQAQFAVNEYFR